MPPASGRGGAAAVSSSGTGGRHLRRFREQATQPDVPLRRKLPRYVCNNERPPRLSIPAIGRRRLSRSKRGGQRHRNLRTLEADEAVDMADVERVVSTEQPEVFHPRAAATAAVMTSGGGGGGGIQR